MTEKLYYTDSYISEFSACVKNIAVENKFTAVVLDKTAFFPLGGGQQPDNGYIGDAFIFDVIEKDGEIYHFTRDSINFSEGDSVQCKINFPKRFIRMQAHSGEHIVSGIAHSLYGAENVGFHMDDTIMTVDFDIPLSSEQLEIIEIKANECVYENRRINTFISDADAASEYDYRSKLDFTGDVRLVEIEGTDLCACCAPHVKSTGEIGLVKILSSVSHRGGVRITLLCGRSAFDDFTVKHRNIVEIAAALCSKQYESAQAVGRLISSVSELKYQNSCDKRRLIKNISDKIEPSVIIVEFFSELNIDELREICNFTKEKCQKFVLALSGNDENGYSYCIYSNAIDLSRFVKDMNSALSGNGGGRGELLQGRLKVGKNEILRYVNELRIEDYENEKKKES